MNNVNDVKIDGSTPYRCRRKERDCVIVAAFVDDGAALVACDLSDDNFMDLWLTESSCLSLLGERR